MTNALSLLHLIKAASIIKQGKGKSRVTSLFVLHEFNTLNWLEKTTTLAKQAEFPSHSLRYVSLNSLNSDNLIRDFCRNQILEFTMIDEKWGFRPQKGKLL